MARLPRGQSVAFDKYPDKRHVSIIKADDYFLGSEDIMGRGDVTIRIADVVLRRNLTIAGIKTPVALCVVYERQNPKGEWVAGAKEWKLNSTNRGVLTRRFGPDMGQWPGQTVTLYVAVVSGQAGEPVAGLRIRPTPDERDHRRYREQLERVVATPWSSDTPSDQAPEREPGADEGEPMPPDGDPREPPPDRTPGETP